MQPGSSTSSFIPKRDSAGSKRKKPARQLFLFSILAYSLIFASLLASGASYLYKNYVTTQLQEQVAALNSEINSFSISDLSRVSEFDLTLNRAIDRLTNTASVVSVLDELDSIVAEPIQLTSLTMERVGDTELQVEVFVGAQSFDSALFQRTLLNSNSQLFSAVTVTDVLVTPVDLEADTASVTSEPIGFTATITVPLDAIPYQLQTNEVQFDTASAVDTIIGTTTNTIEL